MNAAPTLTFLGATDYPLVESARDNAPRTLTDIDMLAVRFGRPANSNVQRGKPTAKVKGPVVARTDPALECPGGRTDMIVAEVKQGRAQVNPGSRNRHALAAAIARFGCCESAEAPSLVRALLQHGRAKLFGHTLAGSELEAIVRDVAARRYSDVKLSAFLAACVGDRMSGDEVVALTRAMVAAGKRLTWDRPADIVTCNTIEHTSNAIDLTAILAAGVRDLLETNTPRLAVQEKTT